MGFKQGFNRHLKPLWDPTSRFLQRVESGKLWKIVPRERHADFQRFLSRAAATSGVDHVALRFTASFEGEDAFAWLSYEVVHRDLDSATLRFEAMYLPSAEDRLAVPDELEIAPIFDIGRVE